MRIPSSVYKSPVNVEGAGLDGVGKGVEGKKAEGKVDGGGKRDDAQTRVDVSKQARQLATDNSIALSKIERLRSALGAGNFRVDARAIAARIVTGD